ncbi:MAG: hypothetical protein E6494_06575, partial [Capnocytophaga sp.]|nr:hypothetical protein [Capnocytophaga sp.]
STVALQWLYSGSTVALQWLYSGSTVALQWLYSGLYSGSRTNKRRTMNEETTNLSRRKVEARVEIKRRLWVDFNLKSTLQFGIYKKTLLLCAFKKELINLM